VGYVFQNHHLIASLTALENVMMPMAFGGIHAFAKRRRRALELLAQVGLAEFTAYRPAQLSTGQRLRVAIARALANTPRLLLADEPTAALDSAAGAAIMDLLQITCRTHEATLIIASHDPAWSSRFSTLLDLKAGVLCSTT
jgi:putative ABC transport system ATP-binding protein